jgi:hypothetical protein
VWANLPRVLLGLDEYKVYRRRLRGGRLLALERLGKSRLQLRGVDLRRRVKLAKQWADKRRLERPGKDRLDLARVRLRAGEHLPLNGRLLGLERPGEDRLDLARVRLRAGA